MDLSIIIVSYNVKDYLKNCLESVLKFTKDIDYEIIVVDNNSTDDSVSYLRNLSDVKNLNVIFSKENGGFTKGNNLGLKKAKGKYVLFLNPDTLLLENTPKLMLDWMEAHPNVGVSSCQHLNSEQKISPTGGYLPTMHRTLFWAWGIDDIPGISQSLAKSIGLYHGKVRDYEKEFNLGWVTGAFMMIRSEAIKNVGYMDENIFMYGEEVEWCWRFAKSGWKISYVPISKFIHYERKSSGEAGAKNSILGEFRGLKYLYGKHCPIWQQVLLGTILDIGAFLRMVMWLIRRNAPMAKIYAEAMFI